MDMGIAFSHCDASWSYSGFHEFRKRLAASIGIDLAEMEGFAEGELRKAWSEVNDPIVPLLNHSDSDGELSVAECHAVWPRLRELASKWQPGMTNEGYDRKMGLELSVGMEVAADANEPLKFR